MMTFLTQRVKKVALRVNRNAAIILVHHTRKLTKEQFGEDPFQALSGASALRGFYSSCMLLFRPDEQISERHLYFELRNGPHIPYKRVDKENSQWTELERKNEPLVNQKQSKKLEAERERKCEAILQLIFDEARCGKLYTSNEFAGKFENKKGLASNATIRDRIHVLAAQGLIKFIKEGTASLGYDHVRSSFGLLCVEDMEFLNPDGQIHPLFPTHYKTSGGAPLPIKIPNTWGDQNGEDA